jgi:hypothetical protein
MAMYREREGTSVVLHLTERTATAPEIQTGHVPGTIGRVTHGSHANQYYLLQPLSLTESP